MASDAPRWPVCTTERLTVRRVRMGDAAAIAAYRSNSEVARYQSWDSFDLARAEALCAQMQGVEFRVPGAWRQMAIVRTGDGAVIGDIGIHFLEESQRQIEVGITMDRAHHGKGYAGEALGAVLDLVLGEMGMHRASARIDARNAAAAALVSRLGFRHEGRFVECAVFKGDRCDEDVFAILRREWEGRPGAGRTKISWGSG